MTSELSPDDLEGLVCAANSPLWEERVAAGRQLARLAGDPEVDVILSRLLLDPQDTAVTYETGCAVLQRGDLHSLRLVLHALGAADADHADELTGVILEVWGESHQVWTQGWERCAVLATDSDEAVQIGANEVLCWQPSSKKRPT
ncbi:hypothetical protein [Micromonospora sp. NPDC005707]|uniref:hypothetical protein n=1 Tax=Micromonospora sp. NPDC005707 TaxID=3157050 RepID=UPI0033E0B186